MNAVLLVNGHVGDIDGRLDFFICHSVFTLSTSECKRSSSNRTFHRRGVKSITSIAEC